MNFLSQGIPYEIADGITVIPTPGHTADDVSVVVNTQELGTVVIAGKLSDYYLFHSLLSYYYHLKEIYLRERKI